MKENRLYRQIGGDGCSSGGFAELGSSGLAGSAMNAPQSIPENMLPSLVNQLGALLETAQLTAGRIESLGDKLLFQARDQIDCRNEKSPMPDGLVQRLSAIIDQLREENARASAGLHHLETII